MAQDKEHLDINLDFLDKDTVPKKNASVRKSNASSKEGGAQKYNWKKILIIGGVILFFGWVIFSEDSSTNNTNTGNYTPPANINDDSVVVGEYTCSRHHYNQAVALNPDESESQITSAQNSLEYRANELERLQNEIEGSYVGEYSSQWEIDQYNETVDEYNSKLPSYKRDAANLDSRIDRYNAQIATHNNYLMNNCTPNR
jgi:peptidoglycan hydrolase CwlO-like protein